MERQEASNSACTVIEQIIIAIDGATVYLHPDDGKDPCNNGIELAKGEFSIVRTTLMKEMSENEKKTISVIAKVGDNLRWPVTNATFIVKVDKLRYSFSVVVPRGEDEVDNENYLYAILNCVVSFKEEDDSSSLNFLDEYVDKYACLITDTSTKAEEDSEVGYNSVLAREIFEDSQQIVNGLHFCTSSYSSLLLHKSEPSKSEPQPASPTQISDALQREKELTLKTGKWREKALNSLLLSKGVICSTSEAATRIVASRCKRPDDF